MKKYIILFCIMFLFASCTPNMTKICNLWKGNDIHKLIMAWGPQTSIYSDGSDGSIYAWEYVNGSQIRGSVTHNLEFDQYVYMYVNKKGIIYHWMYRGFN